MDNSWPIQRPFLKRETSAPLSPVASAEFRRAVGQFPTGVTVVSTIDSKARPYGVTASSFCSLSLDPPLIQWSISTKSFSFPIFDQADYFAINVLGVGQEEVSRNFCKPIDRFATVTTVPGVQNLPLICGSLAWIECEIEERVKGGDHTIFVGRVLRTRVFEGTPLLHWQGNYSQLEIRRDGPGF